MENLKKQLKRYRLFLGFLLVNIVILIVNPDLGISAFSKTGNSLKEMILIVPPIFVLLGLLDVWVERETMMKYMGEGSGIKGILLAFFLGSAAAGPLYVAFPLAGALLKKGATIFNVFIVIGAWATTKIPLILFETTNLGFRFMMIRLGLNIIGVIAIAFFMEKTASKEEKEEIYELAEKS